MLWALGTAALTCSNVSLPDDIRSAVRMAPMPFSALLSSISRLATTCWSSSMGLKDKQSEAGSQPSEQLPDGKLPAVARNKVASLLRGAAGHRARGTLPSGNSTDRCGLVPLAPDRE